MEMLVTSLAELGSDWRAWVLAALVSAKAFVSIWFYLRCPIQCGKFEVPRELAEESSRYQFNPPWSFLLLMSAGVTMATVGLYTLDDPRFGHVALAVLIIGVFLFMTEPSRLRVHSARIGAFAATLKGAEAAAVARDDLRQAQKQRAAFEASIAAGLVMALIVF